MRKILVAAVMVASALVLVDVSPADARPGCVTKTEFNQIRRGATRARVTQVFDIPGRVVYQSSSGGYAFENREYRPCPGRYSFVSVGFTRNPGGVFRVDYKSAYWG